MEPGQDPQLHRGVHGNPWRALRPRAEEKTHGRSGKVDVFRKNIIILVHTSSNILLIRAVDRYERCWISYFRMFISLADDKKRRTTGSHYVRERQF